MKDNLAWGVVGSGGIATDFTEASGRSSRCNVVNVAGSSAAATIFGEDGKIVLSDPWIPEGDRQATATGFTVFRDDRDPERVTVETDKATCAIKAEHVADMLPAVEAAWPAMSWADSLGNMKVLDAWRAALKRANT